MRVKLFILGLLQVFSLSAQVKLNGEIEKLYLLENYEELAYQVREQSGEIRFYDQSYIEDEIVKDKIIINYFERTPFYSFLNFEIGRTEKGQIIANCQIYNEWKGWEPLVDAEESIILKLDAKERILRHAPNERKLSYNHNSSSCLLSDKAYNYDSLSMVIDARGVPSYSIYDWRKKVINEFKDTGPLTFIESREWTWLKTMNKSKLVFIYDRFSSDALPKKYISNDFNPSTYNFYASCYFRYLMDEELLFEILGIPKDLEEKVSLRRDENDQFWIKTKLKDQYDYELLIDTGASITTMNESFRSSFTLLGLVSKTNDTIQVVDANGVSTEKCIYLTDLMIGSRILKDVSIVFTQGTPLLGMNVLNRLSDWRLDAGTLVYKK